MSGSAREEIIQEMVNKHGREAEAPAREMAQIYEDELRRLESHYNNLEQAAVNQDRAAANDIKSLSLVYLFVGLGLGIMAATFAIHDLFISEFVLYLFGAIMSGVGGLLSFA